MPELTKEDVLQFIDHMTGLELSEFVSDLEKRYGVTAATPVAAMGAIPAGVGTEAASAQAEEKTEFDVILKSFGSSRLRSESFLRPRALGRQAVTTASRFRSPRHWR